MAGRRSPYASCARSVAEGGRGLSATRADDEFQRRVAIKLVKRGMDTDFILRRFRHERQILASFDHPHIAQLFDGGTTEDGLPYFVMEYIEGQPIHQFCDARKLSTHERLRLFRQVCSAVPLRAPEPRRPPRHSSPQHSSSPPGERPKLLDFGIAKILNPDLASDTLDPTRSRAPFDDARICQPRTDARRACDRRERHHFPRRAALRLLTGLAHIACAHLLPHEMARVICEEDPERPSAAVAVGKNYRQEATAKRQTSLTPEFVSENRSGDASL